VRFIAVRDRFFEMAILRFDDLITRLPMEWGITRTTHLPTRHCLHLSLLSARL
jgi:hypothetical protein